MRQEGFHAGFTMGRQIVNQSSGSSVPHRTGAGPMETTSNFRLTLTPEQKEQIRKATGKEAEALELSVEELEERIAPVTRRFQT
jgi:hypothetical protein